MFILKNFVYYLTGLKFMLYLILEEGEMYPKPNLEEVRVEQITLYGSGIRIKVVKNSHTVACPRCGTPTSKVYEHRKHLLLDRPYKGKKVEIELNKRRLICINKDCPVFTFTEEIKGVKKKRKYTESFNKFLIELIERKGYRKAHKLLREKYNINMSIATLFYKQLEIKRNQR